jgi:hypothetical protein
MPRSEWGYRPPDGGVIVVGVTSADSGKCMAC